MELCNLQVWLLLEILNINILIISTIIMGIGV
jgi:hypothetical protein